MPTYEYRCPDGHTFEIFNRKMSDAASETLCPVCGKPATRQLSGGAGLVFKGSGFYLTDYGKNAHRADSAGGKAARATAEAASGGGDGKSEAKAGDAKGAEAKNGGEAKGGDAKGAEAKNGERKSTESAPKESKSQDAKSGDAKVGGAASSASSTKTDK